MPTRKPAKKGDRTEVFGAYQYQKKLLLDRSEKSSSGKPKALVAQDAESSFSRLGYARYSVGRHSRRQIAGLLSQLLTFWADQCKSARMELERYSKEMAHFYTGIVPPMLEKLAEKLDFSKLLDCGCGDGSLLYALKKSNYLDGKDVWAIDRSEDRIRNVKALLPELHAQVDSAEELHSLTDSAFDLVISTQVIEHVNDIKMSKSLARVTKPGGYLYLTTVYKKWWGFYFYRNNGKWVLDPTHLREYQNDNELIQILVQEGFELLDNQKKLFWFPITDFIFRRLKISNLDIYSSRWFQVLRKIQFPIFGYYEWFLIFRKKSIF